MACAKHFVGDGGTVNGINEDNTVINREGLMNIHMPAYKNAMDKGVSTVMISYSSWNGVKMHENKFLITQILKDKMRFRVRMNFNYFAAPVPYIARCHFVEHLTR